MSGVDQVLHGGIPAGRTTLVGGGPGSGKTLFAIEQLFNVVKHADVNRAKLAWIEQDTGSYCVEVGDDGKGFDAEVSRTFLSGSARFRGHIIAAEAPNMTHDAKRSTIYFDPGIHEALKAKAASTRSTVSELVNEAVRLVLAEDREDLAAFEERASESTVTYEALLDDLNAHGKI